ncbi:hypothetical protein KVR01_007368 [Diaporthe batatas]|uniref:uncharacterized protein n=1 Tax=Diaporthe batatas TaxID=748121 RepID=UPI001D05955A|nr:uncharacterized protein KVR01_007368 [Diaporthe batatas]KAG8162890.1 hypothetical protein KVR01_007368 [Diaporthe batatas]
MPNTHISHDEFFNKLGDLFTSRKGKDHGSVFLTQKRIPDSSAPEPTAKDALADIKDSEGGASYPVLVRATNGKSGDDRKAGQRVKLATVVQSDDLDAFYARYAEICKAGMLALKPRVRTKRKTKSKKKKTAA